MQTDISIMGYYLKIFRFFGSEMTVSDAIKKNKSFSAVILKKKDGTVIENPSNESILHSDDSLLLLVSKNDERVVTHSEEFKPSIEWTDDLSVGIGQIDDEHLELLKIINKIERALYEGYAHKLIVTVFDTLIEYTVNHFRNEEKFLKSINYPGLAQHKIEHKKLTEQALALNKDKKYIFPDTIADFLYSWLNDHIRKEDKKFGEYYKNMKETE